MNTIIAIYPGRFQPFGKHHAEAFRWLQNKFGAKNTFIATSDKVEPPKSPFSFQDKKQIIKHYGLSNNIVQTKNPYKAEEILGNYDPSTTSVVFMVGSKDMQEDPRFKIGLKKNGEPSYFQEYEKNKNSLQGFDKHGYLIIAPHISIDVPGYGEMSGTSMRNALGDKSIPRSEKIELFKGIFGWYDESAANMIFDRIESVTESVLFSKNWWADQLFLDEGYMSTEQQKNHDAKIEKLRNHLRQMIGREFVYDFNEFPKTVYGVKIQESKLLKEGGSAGHMAHPFDIPSVKTGKDLLKVFVDSVNYLKKQAAAVKIDGVNASIRLVDLDGKKQFVLDRGSMKPLDVKGITKDDLLDRFGEGHGMIKIGGKVLDIFNESLNSIQPELKSLGLWDNPNIMFNLEYVEGSTNVLQYNKNFLAIHGLLELFQATPKRRETKEISYNESTMSKLLNKLKPFASKNGYEILGSIPTELTGNPDFIKVLNEKYTIDFGTSKQTKTLNQWLSSAEIPKNTVKTVDGKLISALSKEVLIKLSENTPLPDFIEDPNDYQSVIDGYFIYLATMKLGDAVLEKLNSPLGPVTDHEGIVIRDPKIFDKPFKITGKFILGGLASTFRK